MRAQQAPFSPEFALHSKQGQLCYPTCASYMTTRVEC
jgi:hypothetical protein